MKNTHAIYWLKRDFRLADNPALTQALANSEIVTPIYIVEPSFLTAPETSVFHVHAATNALHDLRKNFQKKKMDIGVIEGEVILTLERGTEILHKRFMKNMGLGNQNRKRRKLKTQNPQRRKLNRK